MSDMVYSWRPGSRVPLDAQVAGERLAYLTGGHGRITPPLVIDDARPDWSPLHPAFEWDDSAAAEEFRLLQARNLINSLVVYVERGPAQEPSEVRAFVNVTDHGGPRFYTPIMAAMSDADQRSQVIAQALAELHGWQRRYSQYAELGRWTRAITIADEEAAQEQEQKEAA